MYTSRTGFISVKLTDDGEDSELFQQSKPTATITLENGVSFEVETTYKWLPSKLNFLFAMPEDEFSNYDFTRWQTNLRVCGFASLRICGFADLT